MRTVAERATSRSDTVILSDLTCTPDDGGGFDGEISRPWVSSGTLQICANHISGDEVMGGSTLYNDGSVEWQKLSSMQNSIDDSKTGIDRYKSMRVNIYNTIENTYFWF